MRKFTSVIQDQGGNIVAGAELYVRDQGDNSLVTLYSDDGVTETANPAVSGSDGYVEFYTADNTLKLEIYIDGELEKTIEQVQHFDLDNITAAGWAILDDASASAQLTTLGLSAYGKTLVDDADAVTARTTLGLGTIATLDEATTAQVRANTADKALSTDQTWAAADYVALVDAATVDVDLSTGINFSLTIGGNRTLGAPSNTKNGQSGEIIITQDGTGSRTLAYHANWKFVGGIDPVLSTAAGAIDVLSYKVVNSTFIIAALSKGFA